MSAGSDYWQVGQIWHKATDTSCLSSQNTGRNRGLLGKYSAKAQAALEPCLSAQRITCRDNRLLFKGWLFPIWKPRNQWHPLLTFTSMFRSGLGITSIKTDSAQNTISSRLCCLSLSYYMFCWVHYLFWNLRFNIIKEMRIICLLVASTLMASLCLSMLILIGCCSEANIISLLVG